MKKIKWGIIGTGKIANKFASDMQYTTNAKLHAVGSRNLSSAKSFATNYGCSIYYDSYEALYHDEEIEAIYIATPHNFHFQNATDVLQAGKAVLCEKPLTVNPNECKSLIAIAEKSKQYLMEGMWTYFLPSIIKTQEWIAKGEIGQITQIKADFGFKAEFNPNGRLFNPELAGGAMLDIGIYPIALSWLIMKQHPKNIKVVGSHASTGVDMESIFIFEYENETAVLGSSLRTQLPNTGYVVGTEGFIEIPNFWMSHEAILHKHNQKIEHYKSPRKGNGFEYEIEAVSKDIIAGKLQSDIMPLSHSLALQEQMKLVLDKM
ncbi:MAG: Gfo/Idh/MocA family oxidoreductase [Reichenbachiella sp.]